MKKAIRHLSRATIVALEISGALALFLFFAWLGLLWRLSQGPIELGDFVKGHLESAFHEQLPDFTFQVSSAELTWGGKFTPFEFEMQHVAIARTDKTPVFALERLRVQLSKRSLVFGKIVPRVIHLYGPELRVIRQEDGRFTLNVGEAGAAEQPGAAVPSAPDTEDRAALVRGLLRQLEERSGLGILDGLHEIDISDAAVRYEDKVENVSYLSQGSDITFARGEAGIVSSAAITLDMGRDKQAALRATVAYSFDAARTTARVDFTGIIPSLIAQQSEKLAGLASLDLPFNGSVNLDLDSDFKPASIRFTIGADSGEFNAFHLYETPVPVKSIFARGNFDVKEWHGGLEELKIDLDGPKVIASAELSLEDGGKTVAVNATLTDMPLDKVATYWPPALTPDPRWWVTNHLSKGVANRATLELKAGYDPAAAAPVTLKHLGGKIDYEGITVNYFPPLTPVKDVAGSAHYDATSFNLDIASGKLEDMTVGKSTIHITGLDKIGTGEHSKIDIAVAVNGPLKTALKVLDSPPLKYPEMLGIKTGSVGGQADVDVSFKFPIHKGLGLDEVKVRADAKLKEVQIADMVAGQTLTGGPMDLSVDNGSLRVKGQGKIGGIPLQFDWTKNFTKQAAVATKVTASLPLDAATLLKYGVPKEAAPEGVLPATITYAVAADKSAKLDLEGDLKTFGFAIPQAGYAKPIGEPGQVLFSLLLKDGKPVRIAGLDLRAGGAVAKGDIDLLPAGGIRKASFRQILLGNTDISLQAENLGKEGYDFRVNGRQFDASFLFRDDGHVNTDAEAAKTVTPVRASISVNRVITGKDKALTEVHVNLARNMWNRLDRLQVDAIAGGKPLALQYLPQPDGHTLRFEADDAGQALSVLNISSSIRGGKLTVTGHPRKPGGPRDLAGSATLEDFKINDAPVLAKLLNAMSLSGIQQLLTGEGLSFKKAHVNFIWTDRGAPTQVENVRMLRLADGKTSGSSLGLTFEGAIDQWRNIYDLKGTIIPVSDINRLFSIIPVIGAVLTANGEGLIAATYTIKGPKSQPDVLVNPLSVLAPGILRKVFFEN